MTGKGNKPTQGGRGDRGSVPSGDQKDRVTTGHQENEGATTTHTRLVPVMPGTPASPHHPQGLP